MLTTTNDKWLWCKLLRETADDNNSHEDTEGNTDVPCSKAQLELVATDTTGNDDTSLDDPNGNAGVAILDLSATNDELLMANVLEWKTFEDDIETEDSEGTVAVFWPATIELIAINRTLLALLLKWSEDNTAGDVINTQVQVAVIKHNRHKLW